MDCSLPDFSVHRIFQAKITEVDYYFLLQGIFPIQGSNPGLLHCRGILYCQRKSGRSEGYLWAEPPWVNVSFFINRSERWRFSLPPCSLFVLPCGSGQIRGHCKTLDFATVSGLFILCPSPAPPTPNPLSFVQICFHHRNTCCVF